jgi:hypothetical protein
MPITGKNTGKIEKTDPKRPTIAPKYRYFIRLCAIIADLDNREFCIAKQGSPFKEQGK